LAIGRARLRYTAQGPSRLNPDGGWQNQLIIHLHPVIPEEALLWKLHTSSAMLIDSLDFGVLIVVKTTILLF
jgi:hypothetical protein